MSCMWDSDGDGVWHTSCQNAFVFIDGSPKRNSFSYCPYCGETLIEKPYESESLYREE
jgi:hypothetical protein